MHPSNRFLIDGKDMHVISFKNFVVDFWRHLKITILTLKIYGFRVNQLISCHAPRGGPV